MRPLPLKQIESIFTSFPLLPSSLSLYTCPLLSSTLVSHSRMSLISSTKKQAGPHPKFTSPLRVFTSIAHLILKDVSSLSLFSAHIPQTNTNYEFFFLHIVVDIQKLVDSQIRIRMGVEKGPFQDLSSPGSVSHSSRITSDIRACLDHWHLQ